MNRSTHRVSPPLVPSCGMAFNRGLRRRAKDGSAMASFSQQFKIDLSDISERTVDPNMRRQPKTKIVATPIQPPIRLQ